MTPEQSTLLFTRLNDITTERPHRLPLVPREPRQRPAPTDLSTTTGLRTMLQTPTASAQTRRRAPLMHAHTYSHPRETQEAAAAESPSAVGSRRRRAAVVPPISPNVPERTPAQTGSNNINNGGAVSPASSSDVDKMRYKYSLYRDAVKRLRKDLQTSLSEVSSLTEELNNTQSDLSTTKMELQGLRPVRVELDRLRDDLVQQMQDKEQLAVELNTFQLRIGTLQQEIESSKCVQQSRDQDLHALLNDRDELAERLKRQSEDFSRQLDVARQQQLVFQEQISHYHSELQRSVQERDQLLGRLQEYAQQQQNQQQPASGTLPLSALTSRVDAAVETVPPTEPTQDLTEVGTLLRSPTIENSAVQTVADAQDRELQAQDSGRDELIQSLQEQARKGQAERQDGHERELAYQRRMEQAAVDRETLARQVSQLQHQLSNAEARAATSTTSPSQPAAPEQASDGTRDQERKAEHQRALDQANIERQDLIRQVTELQQKVIDSENQRSERLQSGSSFGQISAAEAEAERAEQQQALNRAHTEREDFRRQVSDLQQRLLDAEHRLAAAATMPPQADPEPKHPHHVPGMVTHEAFSAVQDERNELKDRLQLVEQTLEQTRQSNHSLESEAADAKGALAQLREQTANTSNSPRAERSELRQEESSSPPSHFANPFEESPPPPTSFGGQDFPSSGGPQRSAFDFASNEQKQHQRETYQEPSAEAKQLRFSLTQARHQIQDFKINLAQQQASAKRSMVALQAELADAQNRAMRSEAHAAQIRSSYQGKETELKFQLEQAEHRLNGLRKELESARADLSFKAMQTTATETTLRKTTAVVMDQRRILQRLEAEGKLEIAVAANVSAPVEATGGLEGTEASPEDSATQQPADEAGPEQQVATPVSSTIYQAATEQALQISLQMASIDQRLEKQFAHQKSVLSRAQPAEGVEEGDRSPKEQEAVKQGLVSMASSIRSQLRGLDGIVAGAKRSRTASDVGGGEDVFAGSAVSGKGNKKKGKKNK